ncbi:transposase, IS605 OrfB family, central region [Kibdelosporangium aridum]|uniref:Transposase, IS605 OrfB family, central region n=1 Tax=Kibdelosporangium aridum TaxID=2030 RepID=A0A1W2CME0_KIBAR|nr:transposase, IS605 OrfB family, central region [Kibdelosporangium aridum]
MITPPWVAPGPAAVAVRTRLKQLTAQDEAVLRLVGDHLGSLAASDLKVRCAAGLEHDSDQWATRKRGLTEHSSSRWAGSITKSTHDQWASAHRAQFAHIQRLEAGIRMITRRLSLPVGQQGTKNTPGGYRSRREWFAKTRRLHVLQDRVAALYPKRDAGIVDVVRGGRSLLTTRHNLDAAGLTEPEWRRRWKSARRFLQADGESGKRFGNETIRITPDGEVSLKLPTPLVGLANARHGRYVLGAPVTFSYRELEWHNRVETNQAVAYRIHEDVVRGRWYITAAWHRPPTVSTPLRVAIADGAVGVDANEDHLAAWRLDRHGNPVGQPRRFDYELSGTADHRDAQIRHALTRLLHWATSTGEPAVAIEDLNFDREKTREKHGRNTRFRRLISQFPTRRLRNRLVGMAARYGLTVIAVDPAYTSTWGAQHWQKPLCTARRTTTRHEAAAVAIGRRALGHPIRRRTAPPRDDQSDRRGHRTAQAPSGIRGHEEARPHQHGPRTRSVQPGGGPKAGDQDSQDRSGRPAEHQYLLPLSR